MNGVCCRGKYRKYGKYGKTNDRSAEEKLTRALSLSFTPYLFFSSEFFFHLKADPASLCHLPLISHSALAFRSVFSLSAAVDIALRSRMA